MPTADAYRTIGIIGGGTAGYLTALAIRRYQPELRVTLIESPEIPIIGVGEATTPFIVKFLHSYLGKDINDLFRRVSPTWKLGIRFEWGRPGGYFFNYAFHPGGLLEGVLYQGDVNLYSLGSVLMTRDAFPIVREGNQVTSLLDRVPFAYHLDNERFVRYLREEAVAGGVNRIEQTIREVRLTADGEAIAAVVTDDAEERSFDLFVDASGFRSALLGDALRSPFRSFAPSLFTDTAVVASVPHGGHIKPYTVAETMDAGWCWNIPIVEDDHRGYVFSSSFMSVEQAEAEMRRKNPGMGDVTRIVKFRSGRHEHFWKGNCVAIGNAYGFVEPLESTGIHMIIHEINQLILNFPRSKKDTAIKGVLNKKLNEHWDSIRWFLALHYRFNKRLSTEFWQTCNNDADIEGALDRIDLFRERAPLTYRQSLFHKPEEIFSDFGYDILLLGQKVRSRFVEAAEPRRAWEERQAATREVASRALSQEEALAVLRRAPAEVLQRVVTSPETWATWP